MIPGIHEHIPADDYHALDLCSASRLGHFRRSPAHCHHAINHPRKSAAMDLGTAEHACVLEPVTFAARFALGPDVKLNTRVGEAEWAAFEAANVGKVLLRGKDGERLIGMHRAVWAHSMARAMLGAGAARRELTIIWTHAETGVECKSRIDYFRSAVAVDLKTTRDASLDGFARSVANYGYHRRAAFYMRALATSGELADAFCIIAVESEPPHGVAVYRLHDEDLAVGDADNEALMPRYSECVRTGIWPDYGDVIKTIRLPRWARRNREGE